jgi:hypothetical protein
VGADRSIGTLPSNDFSRYSWRSNFNWIPNAKVTLEAGSSSILSQAHPPRQRQQHLRLPRRRAPRLADHAPR